ncbi:MAG: isoleucine--tRNA ligase [Acidimicrobiia bacterium]
MTPPADLPAAEEEVLDLWRRIEAFRRSVDERPEDRAYTFYDGPPFASGSPHYGHILAGIVKDIVPRYWTMRGHRIERRFGWDTHGLPVEMAVEKELGISGPRQIDAFGIDKYNEACRAMVQQTTEDWEIVTERMGRWVDFANDYKTMDLDFMESVWWVFKALWDKGLVYQDFKVLPYSWGATTPLSNFEANLDYREVDDPSIVVRLPVTDDHGPARTGDDLLIWTTTPWTLPSNLAVAVGEDVAYARVATDDGHAWVATTLVADVLGDEAEVVATAPGSDLVGVPYDPPFDYFGHERDRGAFRVILSDDVTTEEGTGLVHMAPAYGEADFLALQAAGLDVLVDPVDAEGRFTEDVPDVAGQNVKEADRDRLRLLRQSGRLLSEGTIRHSYPFCWRTSTPLIYKAIPTWFVKVEDHRDRLVELNERIHWVPQKVGENRFGKWLEGARDWAISRNRYWGSCIPVWECPNGHFTCLGSIDELEALSGTRVDDLHRHFVDPVTFPCPQGDSTPCGATATRVPEVLDCWFESGAMPYAQLHYPFEHVDEFGERFPANFISEGLDQTRGWFYTLVVLAGLLFDSEPFRNCIVFGMILAEDGRKMSKRLQNYPDPQVVLADHGADALRAYLIDSPVVRAEPLRFSEDGVRDVVRTVLLPLWNAYSFFTTYAEADGLRLEDLRQAPPVAERPELDRWLLSVLQSLITQVNAEMEGYYLYNVITPTLAFIDDLTNWYIRRSRRRFWRSRAEDEPTPDELSAFATLYEALVTFSQVLAPVLPFVTEQLYQGLVVAHDPDAADSVHLADWPEPDTSMIDPDLESAMRSVREVVRLGHGLRKTHELRVRQPLGRLTVLTADPAVRRAVEGHVDLIAEELNVGTVVVSADEAAVVDLTCKPDFKVLGPRLGADVKAVAAELAELDGAAITALLDGGTVTVAGHEIGADDVVVSREPRGEIVVATGRDLSVAIDTELDDALIVEGVARELVAALQRLRRETALDVTDRVRVHWSSSDPAVRSAFAAHADLIAGEVLAVSIEEDGAGTEVDLVGHPVTLTVNRA